MPIRKKAEKDYHHGDLATGLLDAVANITAKFGLEAVSLRACAKALGVSPAAAFRHYNDKRALLTAFAVQALRELADAMASSRDAARVEGGDEFMAASMGYITFALGNPSMFQAMWRRELLNGSDPDFQAASEALQAHLASGFAGTIEDDDPNSLNAYETLAWSSVHGLASLMIDGPLGRGKTMAEKQAIARDMLRVLQTSLT